MPDPTKRTIRMIHVPFDYEHPNRAVSCIKTLGVIEVDRTIADAAIEAGAAQPVEPVKKAAAKRRSYRKPAASSAKPEGDEAEPQKSDDVDREDLAGDGGTGDLDAGESDTE